MFHSCRSNYSVYHRNIQLKSLYSIIYLVMTPFTGAIKVPVRWVNQAGEFDLR